MTPLAAALGNVDTIGLEELTERAALQTRVDRKYVLPLDQVGTLVAQLEPGARVLEIDHLRSFAYESVYFDTPQLTSYRLTANRRRRRFKVRTRSYLDSALCWLEVKTQGGRGNTVKHRLPYQRDDHTTVAPGRWFVDKVLTRECLAGADGEPFEPTLITRYRRSTLYLPRTESRVTIDTELVWEHGMDVLRLPDIAVVETKTGSTASSMDRLLWLSRHRPIRISKYATGLSALRPDLPGTPWRRTLRRHFAGADCSQHRCTALSA